MGVNVKAIKPDTKTAAATVRANSIKSWPTLPVMKSKGINTTTNVKVIAKIAKPISLAPSIAA